MKFNPLFLCCLLIFQQVHADSTGAVAFGTGIYGGFKTAYNFITDGSFWQSMGRSFGASPEGYVYSFEVWNDSNEEIHVGLEGVASFMGSYFPNDKGIYDKKILPPLIDSAGSQPIAKYNQERYYFNLYISTYIDPRNNSLYYQTLTNLPVEKNDTKNFYYHAYTQRGISKGQYVHKPKVEMLGYGNSNQHAKAKNKGNVTISDQLSTLNFYNSSASDAKVSLTIDKKTYDITLEKYSFNTLKVPTSPGSAKDDGTPGDPVPDYSLRPNTLTFSRYSSSSNDYVPLKTLKIPDEGFDGYPYTIEVFQDQGKNMDIGVQGLAPGHCDQAVFSKIRDISPCPCSFWYQSVDQLTTDKAGFIDLPGQVWVVYQGIDSAIKSKVVAGEVASWDLLRPLSSSGDIFLYFIYAATKDDSKAEAFVDKVVNGTLGADLIGLFTAAINQPVQGDFSPQNITGAVTSTGKVVADDSTTKTGDDTAQSKITVDQEIQGLIGAFETVSGQIVDADTGVGGYLLGIDVFTSKGLGSGNYYYTLAPSLSSTSSLVQLVSSCLDSSKFPASSDASKNSSKAPSSTSMDTTVTTEVEGWVSDYLDDPQGVEGKVSSYLKQYGKSTVVDSTGAMTLFGIAMQKAIMTGKVSIKFPPIKLSTVANKFVFDFGKAAPDGMPKKSTVLS